MTSGARLAGHIDQELHWLLAGGRTLDVPA